MEIASPEFNQPAAYRQACQNHVHRRQSLEQRSPGDWMQVQTSKALIKAKYKQTEGRMLQRSNTKPH